MDDLLVGGLLPETSPAIIQEFGSFLGEMLKLHPRDRPTAGQLLKHPFVKEE